MSAQANALALSEVVQMEINLSRTATLTGTGLDVSAYEGIAKVVQVVGTPTAGTNPTWDGKIQTSATSGGTYADVSGATFTQITTPGGMQGIAVDLNKCDKFIRYVGTIGGTVSPAFPVGVAFEGIKKYR